MRRCCYTAWADHSRSEEYNRWWKHWGDRESQEEEGVRRRARGNWGGWWKIEARVEDDDRKIQKQWGRVGWWTRQFLSSRELEEKWPDPRQQHLHIYCLQWIMGLADRSTSSLLQMHTHTQTLLLSPQVPQCELEAPVQVSWSELAFEAGRYLLWIRLHWPEAQSLWAPACWWVDGSIKSHAHTSRWHERVHSWLAVLTLSWRQIWLAGFSLPLSLSLHLYPFTQNSEIVGNTACHSGWETTGA